MRLPRLLRHQKRWLSRSCTLLEEEPRVNQMGIQYLSEGLHKKVFPKTSPQAYLTPSNPNLIKVSQEHLEHHGLLGKETHLSTPINIENVPNLIGNNTLDEHFHKIGMKSCEPYLKIADSYFDANTKLPEKPLKWLFKPGWYRYEPGKEPEPVKYPLENDLTFDVETLYKRSPYAVMATAASSKAWYGWVSPFLTNYSNDNTYDDWEHLIPFNTLKKEKLVVGYNVSYDRARILDEYNIKQSKAFYLDGMALHVAVSGICSQQRPTWHKHRKNKSTGEKLATLKKLSSKLAIADEDAEPISTDDETSIESLTQAILDDPWLDKGAPNSLANVADFHCGIKLDKGTRDLFDSLDPSEIIGDFNNLMDYCADDVWATYEVTKKLFPEFREKAPHPVSFAALRHLGSLFLPTTKGWDDYIESAEEIYNSNRDQVTAILKERVNELVRYIHEDNESLKPDYDNDPWLSQLNWDIKEPRLKKDGTLCSNQAYLTGYPEWYRDLFKTITTDSNGEKVREMNISVRTRITPILLRLKWEGHILFWTDNHGWTFKVPYNEEESQRLEEKNYTKVILGENDESLLCQLRDNGNNFELFKVPHPDGPSKRCTSVMSKIYSRYFDEQVLTSEFPYAHDILDLNNTASYWMGNRTRILDQFVVHANKEKNSFFPTKKESSKHKDMAIILPKLVTMGTITRRATENTWLTASNSKKNRIGSELKLTIRAPEGYTFVGADVDSEELWIAALISDSKFKAHGSTALAWMTLEGDKNQKTDLHSKTAEILGISRNDAKVFNYGRIYGAGIKFATRLLKQFNTNISDEEAEIMAKRLYTETKGLTSNSKMFDRKVYHGGTESVMFNVLEAIAHQDDPRTPVLGAAITNALTEKNLNKNSYLTSRINWAIQSSGVDYLHLLVVSMEYLSKKYNIDTRLVLTVHDELRYLVKEEDKYKASLILQFSNLWTRAMFCERLGIKELPQSCAFFSEVDIDKILRKEVTLDCITPSNKNPIPPGESLDIYKVLEMTDNGKALDSKDNGDDSKKYSHYKYESREPFIYRLDDGLTEELQLLKVKLETSTDKEEWRKNIFRFSQAKRRGEYNYFEPVNEDAPVLATTQDLKSKKSNKSNKSTKNSLARNLELAPNLTKRWGKNLGQNLKQPGHESNVINSLAHKPRMRQDEKNKLKRQQIPDPQLKRRHEAVGSRNEIEYNISSDGDLLLQQELNTGKSYKTSKRPNPLFKTLTFSGKRSDIFLRREPVKKFSPDSEIPSSVNSHSNNSAIFRSSKTATDMRRNKYGYN